ncbi:MAG: DoxX family protein [Candidatus Omnitrophota bacterium]
MVDLAILILRFGIGVMFFMHGLQLAFGKFGGSGISNFAKFLSTLGFVPALAWSYIAAYTTLIGGIFLLLGICVRFSSFALLIFTLVALIKVHLSKGFFLPGGFEYTFVIASGCLTLILLGSGKLSLLNKF